MLGQASARHGREEEGRVECGHLGCSQSWFSPLRPCPPRRAWTIAVPVDSILVKDWVPDSSLVVSETNIAKARFPAIDVHVHARGNLGDTPESLAAWVQIMDEAGVEKMIVLSEATGAEFDRLADLYQENYPTRFQLWVRTRRARVRKGGLSGTCRGRTRTPCYRKGAAVAWGIVRQGLGNHGWHRRRVWQPARAPARTADATWMTRGSTCFGKSAPN